MKINSNLFRTAACVVAIAPDNNIPPVAQRAVPQYILLGSLDRGVQREPIEAYVDHLHAAGQRAELVIVEGAEHAFFDWDPDQPAPEAFTQFGIPYAAEILRFFDETFYK